MTGAKALDLDLLLYGDEKLHESEWERDYIKSSISYLEETDAKRDRRYLR